MLTAINSIRIHKQNLFTKMIAYTTCPKIPNFTFMHPMKHFDLHKVNPVILYASKKN